MANNDIRVRFAPSPTGPLHIGGVRTALYNYLFAKKHNGKFILRIEDTDSGRFVAGTEEYINESLKWAGLKFDEGVTEGGDFGPYKQSQRKDIYKKYAFQLIENGWAYFAFDTTEQLETLRQQFESEKKRFSYNSTIRLSMTNSLTLSREETEKRVAEDENYVIRFKMPENYDVTAVDLIRGNLVVNTNSLDDKVLFKSSDQLPTYHLANIVDDYLMKISHVIRGEEWLPSLPLHVMLYKAFGWEDVMPIFAHLPLILKPNGKGKLSKRDGDKEGFPVFPLQYLSPDGEISNGYREAGYFPEAVVNLLALLGWNPGSDKELFSLEELIDLFDIDRVHKSGARFDPEKAKWFNHQYLINKDNKELADLFMPILKEKRIFNVEHNTLETIVGLVKERVNFISELWEQTSFFFCAPEKYDMNSVRKRWKEGIPEFMQNLSISYQEIESWEATTIKKATTNMITSAEQNFGVILNALRFIIVGGSFGPDLYTIIELIGKEETLKRIVTATNLFFKKE
ncbi:MAG: glutamate--tRNA ligase [Marinilabiliaceae bacterium]|nr:glutamate--tRNA ligase [Marinilabiliaceae bacterium]